MPPIGRVAAHLAQRLDALRHQQRAAAHARGGQRGLGAGMAAADHDDVEVLRESHGLHPEWALIVSAWSGGAAARAEAQPLETRRAASGEAAGLALVAVLQYPRRSHSPGSARRSAGRGSIAAARGSTRAASRGSAKKSSPSRAGDAVAARRGAGAPCSRAYQECSKMLDVVHRRAEQPLERRPHGGRHHVPRASHRACVARSGRLTPGSRSRLRAPRVVFGFGLAARVLAGRPGALAPAVACSCSLPMTRRRPLQVLEALAHAVGEERRVGQHVAAGHGADPHHARVAEAGDVEAHAVDRDADRRVVHQPRAGHVERDVGAADVGDDQPDARAASRSAAGSATRCAAGTPSGRERVPCRSRRSCRLEVLRAGADREQPFTGSAISVRTDIDRQPDLVAAVAALVGAAQRQRHHRRHATPRAVRSCTTGTCAARRRRCAGTGR